MMKVTYDNRVYLKLINTFKDDSLFSNGAESAFLNNAAALLGSDMPEKEAKEITLNFLQNLRTEKIKEFKIKQTKYLDLRNLQKIVDEETLIVRAYLALPMQAKKKQKIKFPLRSKLVIYDSLTDCQKLTDEDKQEKVLSFEEEDIYSLVAHISPPTTLKPDISPFLGYFNLIFAEDKIETLNIAFAEKLKKTKVKDLDGKMSPICDQEHGGLNPNIAPDIIASYYIQSALDVLTLNPRMPLKLNQQDEAPFLTSISASLDEQLKPFDTLREEAEGQNTFYILFVLYKSLWSYKKGSCQIYKLDDNFFESQLDTIAFSASIAKEAEVIESSDPQKMTILATGILAKVDSCNISGVIVPVGTPVETDRDYSEHAFYIVIKKLKPDLDQYKVTIINGGYASDDHQLVKELISSSTGKAIEQDTGEIYTFNLILKSRDEAIKYLSKALATEFYKLKSNESVLGYLRSTIYDDKTYGTIEPIKERINLQFYGNCTLHNFNFAIKVCFELDTLNFSKFRQITLLGFDILLSNNMQKVNRMQRDVNKKRMIRHIENPLSIPTSNNNPQKEEISTATTTTTVDTSTNEEKNRWVKFFSERIVSLDQKKASKANTRVTADFTPEEIQNLKQKLPNCKMQ